MQKITESVQLNFVNVIVYITLELQEHEPLPRKTRAHDQQCQSQNDLEKRETWTPLPSTFQTASVLHYLQSHQYRAQRVADH